MSKVIKSKKNQKFTTIFNFVLQKSSLSWAAKGLYCYLNSLPDDWVMYKSEVIKHSSTGRTAFRTAWEELESHGYIIGADMLRADGQFAGKDFIFYDLSEDDKKTFTASQNVPRPLHETSHGENEPETQKNGRKVDNQADLPLHETDHGTASQNVPLLNTNNTTKDLLQIPAVAGEDEERKLIIENKKIEFKKTVIQAGGSIYTKEFLHEFFDYWSEPNGAKIPKLKWEAERDKKVRGGWDIVRRMRYSAKVNYSKIVCLLTEAQIAPAAIIKKKRYDLAVALEKFKGQYEDIMLNKFWDWWATPENGPEPRKIRLDLQEFWSLDTKLREWASRNPQVNPSQGIAQTHRQPQDR